nr:probable LRR receptor-like serine/threonine-protein kinase At3g47570 [Ipomoea batatas]
MGGKEMAPEDSLFATVALWGSHHQNIGRSGSLNGDHYENELDEYSYCKSSEARLMRNFSYDSLYELCVIQLRRSIDWKRENGTLKERETLERFARHTEIACDRKRIKHLVVSCINTSDQGIALLDFKHWISGDPHGVLLNSWNDSVHHCGWLGVGCGRRHQRVVELMLPDQGLVGTISPHIGNLTFLKILDLGGNGFYGEIPGEIGGLFRLSYLNLSANSLSGELAALNLSNCLHLTEIYFFLNALQGKLPASFANLKNLKALHLGRNQLSGGIPPTYGNLSSIQLLALGGNHLEGNIPHEITQCWNLITLELHSSNLTGTFHPAFFNLTFIQAFSISDNSLEGTIPSNIGDTNPNLIYFYFGGNKFHGTIPVSFPNISTLRILDVSENYFVGKVPHNIGMLKELRRFNLELNLLGSNGPLSDLVFIDSLSNCSNLKMFSIATNRFEGKLPNTIANLSSQLYVLGLGENKLSGTIPLSIKNLVNLILLSLEENLLSGFIPSEIGDLQSLQVLFLSKNHFSGKIPLTLFNLTSLSSLHMDKNNLDGKIPSSVGNFRNLNELFLSGNKLNGVIPPQVFDLPSLSKYLYLSSNSFTGPLSPAVGNLKTLNALDISGNKLSGKIPDTIGDCLSLGYLDMHANIFEGEIPPSLVSLKGIAYLDISNNKLTGEIPRGFQNLPLLQYLNLSFNDLEGANASTLGDAYSYGILLLEMFTAKRPTDDLFNSGYNSLYEYVETALPEQVMKIVDPLLLACLESNTGTRPDKEVENDGNLVEIEESKTHNFFISIFKIGLTCALTSPMDRMHMKDVTKELHKIKKAFFT